MLSREAWIPLFRQSARSEGLRILLVVSVVSVVDSTRLDTLLLTPLVFFINHHTLTDYLILSFLSSCLPPAHGGTHCLGGLLKAIASYVH